MSGDGGDNAHNNQFGGGSRGPTGGVNGGPTGLGRSGRGGGWGWSYNPSNSSYIDSSGQPHIVIGGGWSRVPAGNNGGGGSSNVPGGNMGGGSPLAFGADGVFTANVDGYVYRVTLDGNGNASEVTKVSEPPRTGQEQLQIAVANANHRQPEEMFPQLDRSKGEPDRQARATQQAVSQYMSNPQNQARIQREAELRRKQEELQRQQQQEAQLKEEAERRAAAELKKLEDARQAAETRVRAADVMAVRGFPASDAVSLAPVRYSVAGTGSITLDEPMALKARDAIEKALSESSRLLSLNAGGAIGLAIGLLFHSESAGEGSDKVPGRTLDNMFSAVLPADALSLPDENTLREAANTGKTVNLPVRGVLRVQGGAIATQLVRTSSPTAVPVVNATLDASTEYYGFTTPEEAGLPSRTILISPANAPGAEGPTILTGPVPLPEVVTHTGGAVQVPDSPVATTYPKPEEVIRDTIIVFPADSGLKPVYAVFNKPYGETSAKGQYSGRDYNTDRAGGPVQDLDWRGATIDRAGVDRVKLHTGRFGASPDNEVMINRLEKIRRGELQPTDTDKRFYTHEIRELERYRNLGIADGEIPENANEVWNNTHTATLEDYKINEIDQPLYTPEADEAYWNAQEGK